MFDKYIGNRKQEHIRIVAEEDVDFPDNCSSIYRGIRLLHQAYPEMNLEDVDLSIDFLGYRLNYPLMITGMTGGHRGVIEINRALAGIANELGIAIGVGSQRAMVVHKNDEDVLKSYTVVREVAENVPVIGNIGANTLHDLSTSDVLELIESIDADALAVHFNPAQEAIQPEGDTRFSKKIGERLRELVSTLKIPIIVKEVGNGLSMETVEKLYNSGIKYFDVAGACGTNWILVEKYRTNDPVKRKVAEDLASWGISTPYAVIEARSIAPASFIIASGGVWTGLRGIINIVIGADMIGVAKPVIKALLESGVEGAKMYLRTFVEEMRIVSFLVGARNLKELHRVAVVYPDNMRSYMEQRGINPMVYEEVRRRMPS